MYPGKRNRIKILTKTLLLMVLFSVAGNSFSQKTKKDTLVAKLFAAKDDTSKVKALIDLGLHLYTKDLAEAKNYAEQAVSLARQSKYYKGEAFACRLLGTIAYMNGEFLKAKDLYVDALNASVKIRDSLAIANSYRNIALAYDKLNQGTHSVEYLFKAFDIFTKKKDVNMLSSVSNDIGNAFYTQRDFPSALSYYQKSLHLARSRNDERIIAMEYNNIGSVYCEMNELDSGYKYFDLAFTIRKKIDDVMGMLTTYSNFSDIFTKQSDYKRALANDMEALKIAKTTGSDLHISRVMNDLAADHSGLKNFPTALRFADTALVFAKKDGDVESLKNAHETLYQIYYRTGKTGPALEHYQKYIIYRDSLSNSESFKKITQSEMQFMYEKDKEKLQMEQEKKDAVNKEILEKQTILRNSFIAGFIFLLILVFIVYRGYRIKQKSNIEVSKQKHLVEEKQKEILDSIRYAKRIQQSLMTSEKYIEKNISKLKTKN